MYRCGKVHVEESEEGGEEADDEKREELGISDGDAEDVEAG